MWKFIWNISEFWNIPLGRLTPYVFSKMIGQKAKRINLLDKKQWDGE